MRRFMVVLTVGLVALALAGPASAAPKVANTSGTSETIYGEWSSGNTNGSVYLGEDSEYGSFGELYQEVGEYIECAGGESGGGKGTAVAQDTTPGEEFYGFVGTRTWGSADGVRVEFSRKFETGHATASVVLYTEAVDECAGFFGDATSEVGTLDVTVRGSSPIASFRGSGQYKIPSEFNNHENYRGKEREVTGSIVAGGSIDADFSFGYMSAVSWTSHTNG